MSSQSSRRVYLQDEAEKCRWHAGKIRDAETRTELLKLAAAYIEQARDIDQAPERAK
jgi:hypothetical protein